MTSANALRYSTWYQSRKDALKLLAKKPVRQFENEAERLQAKAIVDLTDGIANADADFAAYVKRQTELDNLDTLITQVADAVFQITDTDQYGDYDILEDMRQGKLTYPELLDMIRQAGRKLIEIADTAKY